MKKRGFTLIELLAVIVILAIIALIATPIVMNVIENSRKGAAERSVENYLRAVETAIASERLDGVILEGEYIVGSNGTFYSNGESYYVEMNGNVPSSGKIVIEDGKIVSKYFLFDGYYITYDGENKEIMKIEKGVTVSGLEDEEGIPIVYETWKAAYEAFTDKYGKYYGGAASNGVAAHHNYYKADGNVETDLIPDNIVWTFFGEVEADFNVDEFALSGLGQAKEDSGIAWYWKIFEHDVKSIYLVAGNKAATVKMIYKNSDASVTGQALKTYHYRRYPVTDPNNSMSQWDNYPVDTKGAPDIVVSGLRFKGWKVQFGDIEKIKVDNCYFDGELNISPRATAPNSIEVTNSTFKYVEQPEFENLTNGNENSEYGKYGIFIGRYGHKDLPLTLLIENNNISNYNRGINIETGDVEANPTNINIIGNTITDLQDPYRSAIQLSKASNGNVLVENNTVDVSGNVFTFYKDYNAGLTTIKNNNFKAKYLAWNDNTFVPNIESSNNILDIEDMNHGITKAGVVVDSNIVINTQ